MGYHKSNPQLPKKDINIKTTDPFDQLFICADEGMFERSKVRIGKEYFLALKKQAKRLEEEGRGECINFVGTYYYGSEERKPPYGKETVYDFVKYEGEEFYIVGVIHKEHINIDGVVTFNRYKLSHVGVKNGEGIITTKIYNVPPENEALNVITIELGGSTQEAGSAKTPKEKASTPIEAIYE